MTLVCVVQGGLPLGLLHPCWGKGNKQVLEVQRLRGEGRWIVFASGDQSHQTPTFNEQQRVADVISISGFFIPFLDTLWRPCQAEFPDRSCNHQSILYWLLVHPPWFYWKNYIISKRMKKKKFWRGFPHQLGFISKHFEAHDRGFVKKFRIMETAERNYF